MVNHQKDQVDTNKPRALKSEFIYDEIDNWFYPVEIEEEEDHKVTAKENNNDR